MSRRPTFPISLYLRDRTVLVAGTGPGVERRIHALERAGAAVIRHSGADADEALLRRVFAVIAQTDDDAANIGLASRARAAGALGYAHDRPDASDFAMPAVTRRGPLQIAVSTDGIAPGLAGHIRRQLDDIVAKAGTELDALLEALAKARARGESASLLGHIASRLRVVGRFEIEPDG